MYNKDVPLHFLNALRTGIVQKIKNAVLGLSRQCLAMSFDVKKKIKRLDTYSVYCSTVYATTCMFPELDVFMRFIYLQTLH